MANGDTVGPGGPQTGVSPAAIAGVSPWPTTLDSREEAVIAQANAMLPSLKENATKAQTAFENVRSDPAANQDTLPALRQAANDAWDVYQRAVSDAATQLDNIDKAKREYVKQYAAEHPNLTQADRAAIQLALDKGQAELDFYRAQKAQLASDAKVKAAKDVLDLAQAEYDASVRLPPEERKKLEVAAANAKVALETANAENVRLQNVTLAATAPLAGRNALADIVGKELQNQINAATAAVAPEIATATAATATAGATKATIEAGHWDEKTLAEINNLVQTGVLTQAQAAEIAALLPQKLAMGEANIRNVGAQAARQELETQQLRQGDIATKIEQLSEAVKNGMDPATADRAMEDYLSGSTSFDRQKQREPLLSSGWNTALQAGMVIPTGQQYLPGTEPGGSFATAFKKLGVDLPSVRLTDQQPFSQYMAGQGIQVAEPVAPQRFDATGGYTATPTGAAQPAQAPQVRVISVAEALAQARAQPTQAAAGGGTFVYADGIRGTSGATPSTRWGPYGISDPLLTGSLSDPAGLDRRVPEGAWVPMPPDFVNGPTPNAAGGTRYSTDPANGGFDPRDRWPVLMVGSTNVLGGTADPRNAGIVRPLPADLGPFGPQHIRPIVPQATGGTTLLAGGGTNPLGMPLLIRQNPPAGEGGAFIPVPPGGAPVVPINRHIPGLPGWGDEFMYNPAVPQAQGGTAMLPRAFRGVQGTTPTVDRTPIFRTARKDSKPPMFAKGRR